MDRWEYTSNQDLFFNYCLYEYKPGVPYENKFRSVNLLYHTFELEGVDGRIFEVVRRIRQAVGVSNTVWGVKFGANGLSWEFYFYDYRRRSRERSITALLQGIEPLIPCEIQANENLNYFMFSIDIDALLVSGGRTLDEIHVYIGNPASTVSSGISYSFSKNGRRLENFYFFFDPKKQMDQILGKIYSSAFFDASKTDIDHVLWPELVSCNTICVANKQKNDCVYFSGITVDQFLLFLTKMKYPGEIISFVKDNRAGLDHLLYDVGIDYKIEGNDLVTVKSGYYGYF
jgi:predicted transcriptional regulator